jgi:dihydrofolate synthase/folylpolyglutamate synthase
MRRNRVTLTEWLQKIKLLHVKEIDFSLERTIQVAGWLDLLKPACWVITVAGTNGKGSCVAGIEAAALAAGYRVGAFTTPFLFRYNEQVRLQGKPVADVLLCDAFECIEKVRGKVTLTPFEFGTLAALIIFKKANLELCILEVGMGGRWDAVNIIDADIAVVTSIALDHVDWLGHTRDAIAYEKAGIFRPHRPVVYGDLQPPRSLINYARMLKAPLFLQGQHFGFIKKNLTWDWWSQKNKFEHLPLPRLMLQNMATMMMAIELSQAKLPIDRAAIEQALTKTTLLGRLQLMPGNVPVILDVSHNPAAVACLASYLGHTLADGKTYAVFSMLVDKDIFATIQIIQASIDHWYVAPLMTERAASYEVLAYCFRKANLNNVTFYPSIVVAKMAATQQAERDLMGPDQVEKSRLVVFGSFHTVAEGMVE